MHLCHHNYPKSPSPLSHISFVSVPRLRCSHLGLPISPLPPSSLSHIFAAALGHHRLCPLSFYAIPIIPNFWHRRCHCPSTYLMRSLLHQFPSPLRSFPALFSHGPFFLPFLQCRCLCPMSFTTTSLVIFHHRPTTTSSDHVPIVPHLRRPSFHILYHRVWFSRISNIIMIIHAAVCASRVSTLHP